MRPPRPKFYTKIDVPDSSFVESIQYDPEIEVLDTRLRDGRSYRYRNIRAELFARVITAKSVGSALNTLIFPLPFTRLPGKKSIAQ